MTLSILFCARCFQFPCRSAAWLAFGRTCVRYVIMHYASLSPGDDVVHCLRPFVRPSACLSCPGLQVKNERALVQNVQKIRGRRWNFLAESAGRCFTPLIEIKHNSVSLRWNVYVDIPLIRGRFWLQLWTVRKLSEPPVSWKIPKCASPMDGRTELI